jgi:hypothetical protein
MFPEAKLAVVNALKKKQVSHGGRWREWRPCIESGQYRCRHGKKELKLQKKPQIWF